MFLRMPLAFLAFRKRIYYGDAVFAPLCTGRNLITASGTGLGEPASDLLRVERENLLAAEKLKVHCDVTTVLDVGGVWRGMNM